MAINNKTTKTEKTGVGRKPFEPTQQERRMVEELSGYGLPQEQIAALVRDGIDDETLRKHFKDEILTGRANANAQVGKTLFQKAVGGDTASMIWWSKAQMRWRETQVVEQTVTTRPASDYTTAELEAMLAEAEKRSE